MFRLLASALLLAGAALPAQAGDCYLNVQHNYIMTGSCDVGMQPDGSFAIRDHRGLGDSQLVVLRRGVGEGTWFTSDGDVIPLGILYQGGPTYPYPGYSVLATNPNCWIGADAKICHDW